MVAGCAVRHRARVARNHFSSVPLLSRPQERYSQGGVDLLCAECIVGIIPGFLIAGPLSDRFGRKPLPGPVAARRAFLTLTAGFADLTAVYSGTRRVEKAAGTRKSGERHSDRPSR